MRKNRLRKSTLNEGHREKIENMRKRLECYNIIEDELIEMLLMSSLPSSWETFVTTVCNASTTVVNYS